MSSLNGSSPTRFHRCLAPLIVLLAAGTASAQEAKQTLHLESWPPRCTVEVTTAAGEVLRGRTPWRRELPQGVTRIAVTRRGHKPWTHTTTLIKETRVQACLDPSDQLVQCVRLIPCGRRPKGVALSPDGGQAWVTVLFGPPSVQVFNTFTGEKLATLTPTKHGAVEAVFSADRSKVYFSQMATAQVHEADAATFKVLRSFETKGSWTKIIEISADGKTLFASNWVSSNVSEIDLPSGAVRRRIPTVKTPRGLYATPDGRYLYVAGYKLGKLQKIDLSTGKSTIVFSGGKSLRHIVADEGRKRLYISDLAQNRIFSLDLTTDKVKLFARTNNLPNTIDLSPDGKILFVSNRGAKKVGAYREPGPEWGSVLLLDTDDGAILDAIVGGNQPTALDVSDDGKTLVFSDFLDNRLRVYRVPPYEVLKKGGGGRAKSHRAELRKKD